MTTGSRRESIAKPSNNIRVAVRLRPFSKKEINRGESRVVSVDQDQVVLTPEEPVNSSPSKRHSVKTFRYDSSYSSCSSQAQIFNELGQPLIDHAFSGFNNCILAYGQTGSGKSYTMMGSPTDEGLIPQIGRQIFDRIEQVRSPDLEFSVEASYLEIYNEKVKDLLNPRAEPLRVREHPSTGPYVEDLSKMMVGSYTELRSLINLGNKTRTVAATDMNQASSRSHAVFTITLTQITHDRATNLASEKMSRVSLVDLAGSERSSTSGTSGLRLKEGADINKSLATLGRVISNLAESSNTRRVVPYRDSTLTWLLKDSLGGNSMTTMIATVSPSPMNYEQTLSTLRFADSAKKIENRAVVNEDPNAKLIRELKQELEVLKQGGGADTAELKDQLRTSEKLLEEANQTWEQRLKRTQEIQRERERTLEELGINLDNELIGVHTPKKTPHLVNLSEDPLLAECLVYNIKPGETQVANAASNIPGIRLEGEHINSPHCVFENRNHRVTVTPLAGEESSVVVNGYRVTQPTKLRSGNRIVLGGSQVFRFSNPHEAMELRRQGSPTKQAHSRQISTASDFESAEEYIKERETLVKSYVAKWRESKVMKQVDRVLDLTHVVCDAQAAADFLQTPVKIQLMMMSGGFANEIDHPYLDSVNEEDFLCVRVIDYEAVCVRIWTIENLHVRLKRAQDLLTLQTHQNASQHVASANNNPFLEEHKCRTFIGFATLLPGLIRQTPSRVEIISPFTHQVSGAITAFIGATGLIVNVEGLNEDEVGNVTVGVGQQTRLVEDGVVCFATFPDTEFQIVLHANVDKWYLDKLVSWDEMQEPGLDKSREPSSSRIRQDMMVQVECLELDESGAYTPTEVVMLAEGQTFQLHQGLQRRLSFTLTSPMPITNEAFMARMDGLRLVDCQGLVHSKPDEQVELKVVSSSTTQSDGFHKTRVECQWAHNCVFVDRVTKPGYKIKAHAELSTSTFCIPFEFELVVRPRGSTISRWDVMLGSVTTLKWVTFSFTLEQRPIVPQRYHDFVAISPGAEDSFRARGVSILREYYKGRHRANLQLDLQRARALTYGSEFDTSTLPVPRLTMGDFETIDDTVGLWKSHLQKRCSIDDRLRRWDYRELLMKSFVEQPSDAVQMYTVAHEHAADDEEKGRTSSRLVSVIGNEGCERQYTMTITPTRFIYLTHQSTVMLVLNLDNWQVNHPDNAIELCLNDLRLTITFHSKRGQDDCLSVLN